MFKKIPIPTVIVAAIPYVLMGYPWFSIFRDPWFYGGGLTVEQLTKGPGYFEAFSVAVISSVIMASILAFVIISTGEQTVLRGLKIAFLMWLGFISTLLATQYIFEARTLAYFAITAGYPLIGMLIMGANNRCLEKEISLKKV